MIIIGINSKKLVIIAVICTKIFNVYNSLNLDYCFAFILLQIVHIIVLIVIILIIVTIVIIGFYVIECT